MQSVVDQGKEHEFYQGVQVTTGGTERISVGDFII
jgi:hypothetical protein